MKKILQSPFAMVFLASFIAAQFLLGSLKFSNTKAEIMFRLIYALSFFLNLKMLLSALQRSATQPLLKWALCISGILVLAILDMFVGGHDGQDAIAVLMLPFLHVILLLGVVFFFRTKPTP